MTESIPRVRRDLEFFPVQQGDRKMVLIRDLIGIIPEGRVLAPSAYQLLVLVDEHKTIQDFQMALMRQRGGVLVATDEVKTLLAKLDASYLLDSEHYRTAKEKMVAAFSSKKTRPCFLCGRSYPAESSQLKDLLDNILAEDNIENPPEGPIKALVAPHIDLSAGSRVYASAYGRFRHISPTRVILLGIGHHMTRDLFCVTEKDFATPLGVVKSDREVLRHLQQSDPKIMADNDFEHRSEHSIEFQVLFLQHLLGTESFTILPILCGSLMPNLRAYDRRAYVERAGFFLKALKEIVHEAHEETLIVAGVDFSHIGPKFGHERPAEYMAGDAETHDQRLLGALCKADADLFWEESKKVQDRYHVCGFPAMACLLEVLPGCKGKVLDYQLWHEAATQSAVSFSAVALTEGEFPQPKEGPTPNA